MVQSAKQSFMLNEVLSMPITAFLDGLDKRKLSLFVGTIMEPDLKRKSINDDRQPPEYVRIITGVSIVLVFTSVCRVLTRLFLILSLASRV